MGFLLSGFFKRSSSKSKPRDRDKANRRRESKFHRQMRFEPLEDRCLLAVLGLSIQLYQDTTNGSGGHVPGALINTQTSPIQVGQTFFVEVVAEDYNDTGGGVISLPLNLSWNASVIQYADDLTAIPLFPDGIPVPSAGSPASQLVTASFPSDRFATSLEPTGSTPTNATFDGIDGLRARRSPNLTVARR